MFKSEKKNKKRRRKSCIEFNSKRKELLRILKKPRLSEWTFPNNENGLKIRSTTMAINNWGASD